MSVDVILPEVGVDQGETQSRGLCSGIVIEGERVHVGKHGTRQVLLVLRSASSKVLVGTLHRSLSEHRSDIALTTDGDHWGCGGHAVDNTSARGYDEIRGTVGVG